MGLWFLVGAPFCFGRCDWPQIACMSFGFTRKMTIAAINRKILSKCMSVLLAPANGTFQVRSTAGASM